MKRFTETQKWEDPWFRRLTPEMKLLWQWLCDKCDNAGIIDADLELASFQIGYQYPSDSLLKFGERLAVLDCGKTFIPGFIPFQCGKLSEDCAAHKPIFQSLEKHGPDRVLDRVLEGYQYPLRKGIGKGKGIGIGKEEDASAAKSRGTREEFADFAASIGLLKTDGEYLHDHCLENGWKRGKEPIKDWMAMMRKWKTGGWLPSQKDAKTHRKTEYPQETLQLPD